MRVDGVNQTQCHSRGRASPFSGAGASRVAANRSACSAEMTDSVAALSPRSSTSRPGGFMDAERRVSPQDVSGGVP